MIQELRPEFGLAILLEVSGMPRATFYYHMKRLQKADKYAEVKEQITQICGSPLMPAIQRKRSCF